MAHRKRIYSSKLVLKDVIRGSQNVAAERGHASPCPLQKKNANIYADVINILVGPTREIWNCILSDLQRVCEQLEELDIEAFIEASNIPP